MSRQILITGGAGFIGSNLIQFLNNQSPDWKIQVLDDLSTGLRSNLEGLRCNLVVGSILDREVLSNSVQGADNIIHLAAIGSVPRSILFPRPTHEANITGTLNVMEAAREHSTPHVIVASSSSVYGSNPNVPRSEFDWTRPLSPYAVSKLASEAYAGAYSTAYEIKTLAFRFFNVYGPRQRPDHPYAAVIPKFISAAMSDTPLIVQGDGGQYRDFTFVDSVSEAIHRAVSANMGSENPINLAFGSRTTLLQVIEKIEGILGKKVAVESVEPRAGDIRKSQADASLLRENFPDLSSIGIDEGLARTIDWFRNAKTN